MRMKRNVNELLENNMPGSHNEAGQLNMHMVSVGLSVTVQRFAIIGNTRPLIIE